MSSDLASLNRVFHRLALVDSSEKLTTVLDKLLPRLLLRIGANQASTSPEKASIHTKLTEIISHILKRVRDDSKVRLPCGALLDLLTNNGSVVGDGISSPSPTASTDVHPLTFNLTLTFLGVGIQRCSESMALLPPLLALLEGNHLTEQQDQLVSHLLLTSMEQQSPTEQHIPFMKSARSIAGSNTFHLFLDVLLYQPGTNPNLPSPGLSGYGQKRLLSNTSWNQRWLSVQETVLDLIRPSHHNMLLSDSPTVALLVVASSSPHHTMSQRASTYLKQVLEASHSSSIDTDTIQNLLSLCRVATEGPPAHRRRPLGSAAAATVLEFCAQQQVSHHHPSALSVDVAIQRLAEDDARLKTAAVRLLRSVATAGDGDDTLALKRRCLDAAQSILTTENTVLVVVRDTAYGIVAAVARQLPLTDLTTAQLLFRCVAQEQERLRPRAVAALDAVSASLQRYVVNKSLDENDGTETTLNNPWSTTKQPGSGQARDHEQLGRSLVPILWTAAQSYQNSASRAASAHWSDEVLRHLDLPTACHLLCYLTGDPETATIAQEGLHRGGLRPSFAEMVQRIFPTNPVTGRVKSFVDFSATGQANSLRFVLGCMLDDMYANDDERAMGQYLTVLIETMNATTIHADVLDACTECLLSVVGISAYARTRLLTRLGPIAEMAVTANSAPSRRQLAGVYGKLLEHRAAENETWVADLDVESTLATCMTNVSAQSATKAQFHGSLYMSAHILRVVRHHSNSKASTCDLSTLPSIIKIAGKGVTESDDAMVHGCADALFIAYSYDGPDAPALDRELFECSASVLSNIALALQRFGHGDTANPTKIASVIKSAGACLAATTTASSEENIGVQRIACVGALYKILGSASNKKDEEIGIRVGEALGAFADGFSPKNALWTHPGSWPDSYDDEFASQLPPHDNVLFVVSHDSRSFVPVRNSHLCLDPIQAPSKNLQVVDPSNTNRQCTSFVGSCYTRGGKGELVLVPCKVLSH